MVDPENAREVGLSRQTVVKFLRAGSFPERADRVRKPGLLDPFVEFIRERWTAGCRNAARLWRELRERGFQGSSATVRLFCRRLPDGGQVGGGSKGKSASVPVISARRAMWMLTLDPTKLTGDERMVRDALLAQSPDIAAAADLGRRFLEMVRKRGIEQLDQWLIDAGESGSLDLKGFGAGLRRDEAAVRAALEFEWSNGQTEGQVLTGDCFFKTQPTC